MFDELIRRALASASEPNPPSPALLTRAVAEGEARRRRRLAGLVTTAALAVVAAGTVVATRRGGEEIVGVSPTPATTGSAGTTTPPPSPSASNEPTTNPPTTSVTTTISVHALPPTVPGGTSAPFVAQPPEPEPLPCDPAPELTADRVTVSVVGPAPERWDGVLAWRYADVRPVAIELWGPGGLATTITDSVPDDPEQWYCPTGLLPAGYDGRFVWATVGGHGGCAACAAAPPRARLFRADVTTGDVTEAWSSTGDDQVVRAVPATDGSVSVLSGPRFGSQGQLRFVPSSEHAWIGERTWELDGPLVDAQVAVAGSDPLARPYVVYVTGGPYGSPTTLHVVVLGEGDQERTFDLTGVAIEPGVIGVGVAPDGGGVLVTERWEGIGAVRLVRLAGGEPEYVGSGACWTSTGLIARSTWSNDSEQRYDEPGTVQLVRPSDLAVVADFDLNTYGGALACLPGDRVAFTAYDAVSADPTAGIEAGVLPDSQRILILVAGESTEVVRAPDLWVIGRNADD